MTTTMHKHGGVHEWDMTLSDAREAIYVRNHLTDQGRSWAKYVLVVQRHIGGICPNHSLHEVVNPSTLPPSIFTATMGLLRLGSSSLHDHPDTLLRRYYFREDMGVYSTRKNMEQVGSRDLYQNLHPSQY